MKTISHVVTDPMGLHARPAAMLVKIAAEYDSIVTLTTEKGSADAKRIFGVMRVAVSHGQTVELKCDGPDEDAAADRLQMFLKENL